MPIGCGIRMILKATVIARIDGRGREIRQRLERFLKPIQPLKAA